VREIASPSSYLSDVDVFPGPQSDNIPKVAARLKFMQSRTSHRARRHALNFEDTYSPYRPIGRLLTGRDGEGTKKNNPWTQSVCVNQLRGVPVHIWERRGGSSAEAWGSVPTDSENTLSIFPQLTAILLGPIHLFSITSRLVTSIPDSEPNTDSPHRPLPSSHGGAAEHGIVNRRSQLSHFQSRSKERSTVGGSTLTFISWCVYFWSH